MLFIICFEKIPFDLHCKRNINLLVIDANFLFELFGNWNILIVIFSHFLLILHYIFQQKTNPNYRRRANRFHQNDSSLKKDISSLDNKGLHGFSG